MVIPSFTQTADAQSCGDVGYSCIDVIFDPWDPDDDDWDWVSDPYGGSGHDDDQDDGGGGGGSDPCGKSASALNTKATCDDYVQPVNPLINCNTPNNERIAEARRLFLLERDWAKVNLFGNALASWYLNNQLYDVNYSDGTLEDFWIDDTQAINISISISGITTCG